VYEKNDTSLASSYAVKMHALSAEARAFAVNCKFYDKELFFYNHFKDSVSELDFAIPKVHAIFKDTTVMSSVFGDANSTNFFNLVMEVCIQSLLKLYVRLHAITARAAV
jgi:hypothetical protein